MGIPSYFAFIIKNFPEIIQKKILYTIDNLYLDSNSIVYDSVYSLEYNGNDNEFEKKVIERVCNVIDGYCTSIQPKNVFITFDGVAPVAKLNQQKSRRYKSWFTNEMEKHIKKDSYNNIAKWNTSSITPGTNFMNKLNTMVFEYFLKAKKTQHKDIHFEFSGSDEPGEGEHKIFDKIRNEEENHKNSHTLVYGLDADLIMLCLHHKHLCKSLNLYRETPHFIKQLDSSLNPNETYVLNTSLLSEKLITTMSSKTSVNSNDLIHDYIFICFLLGNDFMPHHPAYNIRRSGIHVLLDVYKFLHDKDKKFILTKNSEIQWNNVRKYIELLSEQEEKLFQEEHTKKDKQEGRYIPNKTEEERWEKFQITPCFERSIEHFINPNEPGWEQRYYKTLFDVANNDSDRIKQVCFNYLEALEWTFSYYTQGCKDWKWKYNYKYAPLFKDLIKYIPYFDTELLETKLPSPIPSVVQLAYVLPNTSYNLLPTNVVEILNNHFQVNGPYEMSWAYMKYFFETHIEFPEMDIDELVKHIVVA
jgi:5'-3' exoribonuclease 1